MNGFVFVKCHSVKAKIRGSSVVHSWYDIRSRGRWNSNIRKSRAFPRTFIKHIRLTLGTVIGSPSSFYSMVWAGMDVKHQLLPTSLSPDKVAQRSSQPSEEILSMRVVRHWHGLLSEAVEVPLLEMCKTRLGGAPASLM